MITIFSYFVCVAQFSNFKYLKVVDKLTKLFKSQLLT